jgi:hypothetical protein
MKKLGILLLLAGFLGSCSPEAPLQYPTPETTSGKSVAEDTEAGVTYPAIDILFVVDNSGSMGDFQAQLSTNIQEFTNAFLKTGGIDYHIGVITSDMSSGKCCGRLVGTPSFVTPSTPNANTTLAQTLLVGTTGSGSEFFFRPIMTALSEPTLSSWNQGFYRKDAPIVIIFITDADEPSGWGSSGETPQNMYNFLLGLKGGDKKKVIAYGAVRPLGSTTCTAYEDDPVLINEFLKLVSNAGTNLMDLCSPDYGKQLARLGDSITKLITDEMILDKIPEIDSIRVTFGAIDLPKDSNKGWSYNPDRNSIKIGKGFDWNSQPVGTKIKIFYTAAKLKP